MHATTPRGRRAGRRASITDNSVFTVPSSAFTGRSSESTIDFGSPKNERYRSHGTSAIKSGAATGPGYAPGGVRAHRRATPPTLNGHSAFEHPAIFAPEKAVRSAHQGR